MRCLANTTCTIELTVNFSYEGLVNIGQLRNTSFCLADSVEYNIWYENE